MLRLCLVSCLPLALSLPLFAGDWSRFRGPNGQGTADGPLPPIDPKAPLWKVEIPGKGAGSPIVVAGKVYLQTASTDGTKRTLMCLDAATGKALWAKDQPGQTAKTHNKNSLASSTPACDGEQIYCVWWDGRAMSVAAYDLNGNERWSQSLGAYQSQHGVGHSPAVFQGKVFVNFDQDGAAEMVALDAKTGTKVWTAPRPEAKQNCYTTPVVLERPGKPAGVVVVSSYAIDSYDPDTGKVQWHYTINWPKGEQVLRAIAGPVFADGVVIASFGVGGGGEKSGRYMVAVKTDGTGDVTATGKAWELKAGAPYVPTTLVKDDHIYWFWDFGIAYCAKAKTGEIVGKTDRLFGMSEITSSPILVGDSIVAIGDRGRVVVLKATPELDIAGKDRVELGQEVYASPAYADGRLYVRGRTHLFCFGKK
jgi:outer membrane protein assembly factor BamB